jgi:type IV pilus assembly protein PilE
MIGVLIVALLAAIALPNMDSLWAERVWNKNLRSEILAYQDSTLKSRRADAVNALQQIQIEQEKLRSVCTTYATTLTGTIACGNLGFSSVSSPDGYYTLELTSVTATGFTATATAVAGQSQANDTGCTSMVLAVSGLSLNKTPAACWSN